MGIPTGKEVQSAHMQAEKLEQSINRLLSKNTGESYMEICELLERESSMELATWSQNIYILSIMSFIQRAELNSASDRYLFQSRNIGELIYLYKRLVMLLRRIEFDFSWSEQCEIADYVKEEQISMVVLFGIIQGTKILYQKDKIMEGLMKILGTGAEYE